MTKAKKIALGALNFVLSLLIVISLIAASLSHLFFNVFTNSDLYVENCLTEEFYDAAYSEVEAYVRKATASVVSIDEADMKEVLDRDQIRNIANIYAENYIRRIFDGRDFEEIPPFESEDMKNLVRNTIYNGVTEAGFEISEEQLDADSEEAYELLRGYVDSSVKFIPSVLDGAIAKAGSIVSALSVLSPALTASAIVFAVCIVIKLIANAKKGLSSAALSVVAPAWIASAVCFAPFVVIHLYDVTSRLAVTPGTSLYIYLCGLINTVLNGGFRFTLTVFIVLTVLLIISIVFASFVKADEDIPSCEKEEEPAKE